MSDKEAIIDAFVGNDYVSDGDWNGIPAQHAAWFPVAGVRMTIFKVPMTQAGKAYAKVTISASPAKGAIEKALYRALDEDEDTLVAQDIELQPGLFCKETLAVVRDAQQQPTAVEHRLEFSDGTKGIWLCPHAPHIATPGVRHA
jgi:hypothetical protein